MTTLRLTLTVWKCNKTEEEFQTYGLDGMGSYGEFLMYAQNGDKAYWNALGNPAHKSFVSITDAFAAELSLNRFEVFDLTCGVCCDAAPDGSFYSTSPYCPSCADTDVSFIDMPEPFQHKTFVLPNITHMRWNSLSEEQRKTLVRNAMKRVGLI